MTLRELIAEIKKLNSVEQHRLKEFFFNSLASFSASEPVFQEVTERKNKDGYSCVHCGSKQVVRFGKYMVKLGLKEVERQPYRCKDCRKTFTDVTSTPLYRTHKPDKWLDFIKCMSIPFVNQQTLLVMFIMLLCFIGGIKYYQL